MLLSRTSSDDTNSSHLTDMLGSVRLVASPDGAVEHAKSYDSFGNVTTEGGPSEGDRFAWTARERSAVTALMQARARFYAGSLGRFVSVDPVGFAAADRNLFSYVRNRSTAFVDPTGLGPARPSADSRNELEEMLAAAKEAGVYDQVAKLMSYVEKYDHWDYFISLREYYEEWWKGCDDNEVPGAAGRGPCIEFLDEVWEYVKGQKLNDHPNLIIRPPHWEDRYVPKWLDHDVLIYSKHAIMEIIIVTPEGPKHYYIDNGYLGGRDNVFTDKELQDWKDYWEEVRESWENYWKQWLTYWNHYRYW